MIGIIGGTGVYEIVTMGDEIDKRVLKTPYGNSPEISLFQLHGKRCGFHAKTCKRTFESSTHD